MKKPILLGLSVLAVGGIFADNGTEPLKLEEFYAQKISPNGVWLYSNTGEEAVIYNLETHEFNVFDYVGLGNGNPFALDGTAVGSSGGGVIIKGDKAVNPSSLASYAYSNINGITGDAHRVAGVLSHYGNISVDENNQMYLPFVMDIDDAGNCSDPVILPHPDRDFLGMMPQYSSATWISDDGKVVLGQMVDYSGLSIQPIVYRQGEDGEWSYSLPSESIFNPEHLSLPEYPGEFDYDREPDVLSYMTPEDARNFLEDMDWWETEGNFSEELYPGNHLEDYMTPEEYEKYNEALIDFMNYYYDYMDKINAFIAVRDEIISASPSFLQNGSCLNREGTIAALTNLIDKETSMGIIQRSYGTYILDLKDDTLSKIEGVSVQALQVLDGGIVLGSVPPEDGVQQTYVYVPGSEGYIPVEEYLESTNPYVAEWMRENLVHEVNTGGGGGGISPLSESTVTHDAAGMMISGNGVASADFSVFAAGVPAYIFDENLIYLTYVFTDLTTGVRMITPDESAIRTLQGGVVDIKGDITDLMVVDLSGRKVFALPVATGSVSTGLARGIYVIVYTDANGRRLSQKVRF